jgi:hypothetical protein
MFRSSIRSLLVLVGVGCAKPATPPNDEGIATPAAHPTIVVFFEPNDASVVRPFVCYDGAAKRFRGGSACLDLVPARAALGLSGGATAKLSRGPCPAREAEEPECRDGAMGLASMDLDGDGERELWIDRCAEGHCTSVLSEVTERGLRELTRSCRL